MIKIEDVKRVYSGKPGCMCGCRGTYRSPSTVTLAELSAAKGYEAEPKEINDRQVRKVVAILNKELADCRAENVEATEDYTYLEVDGRAYCAYFQL